MIQKILACRLGTGAKRIHACRQKNEAAMIGGRDTGYDDGHQTHVVLGEGDLPGDKSERIDAGQSVLRQPSRPIGLAIEARVEANPTTVRELRKHAPQCHSHVPGYAIEMDVQLPFAARYAGIDG